MPYGSSLPSQHPVPVRLSPQINSSSSKGPWLGRLHWEPISRRLNQGRSRPTTWIHHTSRSCPDTMSSGVLPIGLPALLAIGSRPVNREGQAVELQIRIDGGAADDYVALTEYLNGSRDFRGRVKQVTGPPADGKLDAGIIEMLTVAAGSGGLGVALTTSVNKWLENRRPDVTVEVTATSKKRTVKVDVRNVPPNLLELFRDIMSNTDER
jgi:Effector Associated Constant Component 1